MTKVCRTRGGERRRPRHRWTKRELVVLRREYPHKATRAIARNLGLPLASVYAKANNIGLRKSAKFLATSASGRILKGGKLSVATQFKPGHASHNKGLRRPGWHRGRMKEAWFKKGHRPHTWRPVGTYRINGDGYLDRKISDTGYPPRDWVAVHRLVWIKANGPIPPGHIVCFKAGRFSNELVKITPDALQCISRKELAKRNVMWNRYPKDLARVIQLRGALNRQINRRAA